jgi:hypothetical protein
MVKAPGWLVVNPSLGTSVPPSENDKRAGLPWCTQRHDSCGCQRRYAYLIAHLL